MREIKFRGKNKDIGWVYGQLVYDTNGNPYIVQEVEQDNSYGLEETMLYATIWYRVDPETIGQYTGLKDKNEKEIYEGDTVKLDNSIIGKVIFDNEYLGYFIYANEGNSIEEFENGEQPLYDYQNSIEIIGNITDNSLEEVQNEQ